MVMVVKKTNVCSIMYVLTHVLEIAARSLIALRLRVAATQGCMRQAAVARSERRQQHWHTDTAKQGQQDSKTFNL